MNLKWNVILFSLFCISLMSISAISAQDINDTIIISEENNDYDELEITSLATNFTTLQKEINENNEITLNNNVTMSDEEKTTFTNGLLINKTISIDGNGYIIDANNTGRIFNVTSTGDLTLKNDILVNGIIDDNNGGAIYSSGKVSIYNSTFKDNAAKFGGAIINDGGGVNLTVINSTFIGNNALTNSGGAIYNSGDNFTVINSTFTNNTADKQAGAIFNFGANFTVLNSTFTNNTSNFQIGAIANMGNGFKIVDSIFIGNNATGCVGAVWIKANNSAIINSTFINNSANEEVSAIQNWQNNGEGVNCTISNCTFINNTVNTSGSVIYNDGDVTVSNSTFFDNSNEIIYNKCELLLENITAGAGAYITNNEGTIKNTVNVYVLDNETKSSKYGDKYLLYATVDYESIPIYYGELRFDGLGNSLIIAEFDNNTGMFVYNYTVDFVGQTEVTAKYHNASTCNVYTGVLISKLSANVSVVVNDSVYGMVNTVYVNLTSNTTLLNGNVTVTINGKNYTVSVANGQGSTNISDLLKADTYDVNATWIGDENYYDSTANTTFTISKATPSLNISIEDITYGDNATVTVNLTTITPLNDTVTVILNNESYNITIVDGVGNAIITGLASDNYTATVIYNGNENYTNTSSNVSFNVNKAVLTNVTLSVTESVVYGETTKVTVKCYPRTVSGNVSLYIDGELYNTTDLQVHVVGSGEYYFYQGYFNISNLSLGNHTLYAIYNGNENYTNKSSDNKTLTVTEPVTLTLENLTKYYNDTTKQLIATLTNGTQGMANETITFTVNGCMYNRTTDENGIARLNINLIPGVYLVNASYTNTSEVYIVNATVTVLTTINATDLVKVYHNESQFYATFYNTEGSALADTNVTFNIRGVYYTRMTDSNGTAKLNINLDAGSYIITAVNPVNNEMKGFNITVLSSINSSDVVKYYRNGTHYFATFTGFNGEALANTNVTFNINGVFYNRTTDSNGTAMLNINLRPLVGDYVLTAYNPVTGEAISNRVTVLPVLTGADVEMTTTQRSQYLVYVVDDEGNPLAGETVSININGVFYNRITDDNGVAHLNINLDVGTYIATTSWNGSFTSNTVTVKP